MSAGELLGIGRDVVVHVAVAMVSKYMSWPQALCTHTHTGRESDMQCSLAEGIGECLTSFLSSPLRLVLVSGW